MEQLITINHRVEFFERLLNTASALLNKIRDDYEKIRQQSGCYAFFLPGDIFALEQDFEELYATLQALTLALENIGNAMQQDSLLSDKNRF